MLSGMLAGLHHFVDLLPLVDAAILPAAAVTMLYGAEGTGKLLILSQVVLSLQLPFAVVPLVRFTADKGMMGPFASPIWLRILAWIIAAVIIGLNLTLLWGLATG